MRPAQSSTAIPSTILVLSLSCMGPPPGPQPQYRLNRVSLPEILRKRQCKPIFDGHASRIINCPTMSYQVLARKYRPQKFSEVIGQEHVTRTLKNAIEQGRTAHGYIFSGHRGIGKTTVARILAMALNCRSSDKPVPEPCGVCDSCTAFRAVRFEEMVGQLKDLIGRENIEADEDALALLAEAGDGSMRDALSILDQAIASSSGRLTAEQVRNLVGAAPSGVLENVMCAIAQGSSEEVLRLVDKLLTEGHSPAHFARQ